MSGTLDLAGSAPTISRGRGGSALARFWVGASLLALVTAGCGGDAQVTFDADDRTSSQTGTAEDDVLLWASALIDGGFVASGSTIGEIAAPPAGGKDAVVRFELADGSIVEDQFGTGGDDAALGNGVAPDGSVYVAGYTNGDLAASNEGSADVWAKAYDPDGTEKWIVQLGGPLWDRAYGVVADNDGVFVTGYTFGDFADTGAGAADAFVARLSTSGDLLWLNQYGSDQLDWGQGAAAAPDGGVYLVGFTEGSIAAPNAGERDAFVMHIDASGGVVSSVQFGTDGTDWATAAATSDTGVVVVGHTAGKLGDQHAGDADVFVAAFDDQLTPEWTLQLGSEAKDQGYGIAPSGDGFLVSGFTMGLVGSQSFGDRDGVALSVAADGSVVSVDQFGSPDADEAYGVSDLADGSVVFVGYSTGSFAGAHLGGTDIIEVRYK